LALGVAVAAISERLDPAVYDATDVDSRGARVLGPVAARVRLNARDDALYARLGFELAGIRTLVVTGADRSEPVPVVVHNIAINAARTGAQVAIVDGDVRAPALHDLFGVPNEPGLQELRYAEADIELVIHKSAESSVLVVPAGHVHSGDTVGAGVWDLLLGYLTARTDQVLVSAPPILEGIETSVLLRDRARVGVGTMTGPRVMSDEAAAVVVSIGRTRRAALETTRQQLEAAESEFVVLLVTGRHGRSARRRRRNAGRGMTSA
jgi:Mrp family chromosome partitioning ATPase